jgi:Ras-related GTP-binding protein A/B
MENYFTAQRDNIFRNVEVLIYVFDVESREIDKDIHYYQSCLESMAAVLFCFIYDLTRERLLLVVFLLDFFSFNHEAFA